MATIHLDRKTHGEFSKDDMARLAEMVRFYPGTILHNAYIVGDADIHTTEEMSILTNNTILDRNPAPSRKPGVRNLGLTLAAAGVTLIGLYVHRKIKEGAL